MYGNKFNVKSEMKNEHILIFTQFFVKEYLVFSNPAVLWGHICVGLSRLYRHIYISISYIENR